MALSYTLRLACLFVVSVGLLQIAFELLLWAAAPILLRLLRPLSLRQNERALYLVQVVPLALATALTAIVCVPRYIANETNFEAESVGWLCLALASILFVWWATRLAQGFRIAVRTLLFARACKQNRAQLNVRSSQTDIIAVEGASPRVGLVGLIRPFIFISQALLNEGGLDPAALQIVLDHERSHAAQRDNWKLLSLHCLPRVNLRLSSGKTWMELWQSTAEWAADEDAVQGSNSRALLLAETLVALARRPGATQQPIACTNFVCAESELAARVERLIVRSVEPAQSSTLSLGVALGCMSMGVAAVLVGVASVLGDIPERLLHLG